MQQHGSPVRPDYKRGVHRVGHAEVLAEAGRVWGRHRRDKDRVGVFRWSWGGCSVGWAGVGWGLMSQVAQDEIQGPVEPVDAAPVVPLGVALPEHDRVFVVDPDSEVEDQASSDEGCVAFDGMVSRALRDHGELLL